MTQGMAREEKKKGDGEKEDKAVSYPSVEIPKNKSLQVMGRRAAPRRQLYGMKA